MRDTIFPEQFHVATLAISGMYILEVHLCMAVGEARKKASTKTKSALESGPYYSTLDFGFLHWQRCCPGYYIAITLK